MYLEAEDIERATAQKEKIIKCAFSQRCKQFFVQGFLLGIDWFYEVWEL